MELVSSLLTNILTIGENPSQASISLQSRLKRSSLEADTVSETETVTVNVTGEMSKKPHRRSMDLDFSSFWKKEDPQLINMSESQLSLANIGLTSAKSSTVLPPTQEKPAVSSSTSSAQYMADKLMEKVISVMVSNEIVDDQTNKVLQERIKMQKQRPSLSIALIQSNSNELHQRNSNMYIFIDRVEKFFGWQDTYYTIGLLLIITHIILNPYLITILPFIQLIATTFVPHYLSVYPPDTNFNSDYIDVNPMPSDKPLNTYSLPKPAPLYSKEFFMNLTDTQNFMTLNIKLFDFVVWLTSDYLYFKNEQVTSLIFLVCVGFIFGNLYFLPIVVPFLLRHFIIVQLFLIANVWSVTILLHPTIRGAILEWIYKEDTRLNIQQFMNKLEDRLSKYLVRSPTVDQAIFEWSDNNDSKVVEIYELQKMNTKTKIWELVGFTPNFYTINLVVRRYNNAILELEKQNDQEYHQEDDAKFLNLNKRDNLTDIVAPVNYKFLESEKWKIDYNINAWVEENLIQDLVIIDEDEKWAYDIIANNNDDGENDNDNDDNNENDKDDDYDHKKDSLPDVNTINELSLDQIEKLADNHELFRRRRWIRKVTRMNYRDKKEQQVATSTGISSWV